MDHTPDWIELVSNEIFDQELAEFKLNASLHGIDSKDIESNIPKDKTSSEFGEIVKLQGMGIGYKRIPKEKDKK